MSETSTTIVKVDFLKRNGFTLDRGTPESVIRYHRRSPRAIGLYHYATFRVSPENGAVIEGFITWYSVYQDGSDEFVKKRWFDGTITEEDFAKFLDFKCDDLPEGVSQYRPGDIR